MYHRIEIPEVFDIYFFPEGTYLCLWCKPIQLNKENGTWNNNLKIFNIKTKTIIAEWVPNIRMLGNHNLLLKKISLLEV